LLIAITFSLVALVLIGQVVDKAIRPIPGLIYLFAACDPPAVAGGWLAAMGAMRAAPGSPAARSRGQLLVAAIALTVVAIVVLGDFGLSRIMKGSGVAAALGSKPAWLVADAATVAALGALAVASSRLVEKWSGGLTVALGVLLLLRLVAGVWGALGTVPLPLRLSEAVLYGAVAWSCCRAAISVRT
jgi:hypothetical protein